MKLAPRAGVKTSLVEVNGRIRPTAVEGSCLPGPSARAGIPASASADAPAAPFNNSRRESLASMIASVLSTLVSGRGVCALYKKKLAKAGSLHQDFSTTYVL